MGFLGGGVGSATQSLDSALTFNPIFNIGDDNTADLQAKQSSSASATAKSTDEFGLSASVGVGVGGGSGSGGAATLSKASQGDIQPTKTAIPDGFFNDTIKSNPALMYGGIAVAIVGGGYYFYKKSKKSK